MLRQGIMKLNMASGNYSPMPILKWNVNSLRQYADMHIQLFKDGHPSAYFNKSGNQYMYDSATTYDGSAINLWDGGDWYKTARGDTSLRVWSKDINTGAILAYGSGGTYVDTEGTSNRPSGTYDTPFIEIRGVSGEEVYENAIVVVHGRYATRFEEDGAGYYYVKANASIIYGSYEYPIYPYSSPTAGSTVAYDLDSGNWLIYYGGGAWIKLCHKDDVGYITVNESGYINTINYFYQSNLYITDKTYYAGYYYLYPVKECYYDSTNDVWYETDKTTTITWPDDDYAYLFDTTNNVWYLYMKTIPSGNANDAAGSYTISVNGVTLTLIKKDVDGHRIEDYPGQEPIIIDYSFGETYGIEAHLLNKSSANVIKGISVPIYKNGLLLTHYLNMQVGSSISIGKISGSGKLKVIADVTSDTTITATWQKFNGITNRRDISTIQYVYPNPSTTKTATSNGLQVIELSCTGLVYTDINIVANYAVKVYAITWEPDSYFYDLTKFGFDNNVYTGHTQSFINNQEYELATTYGNKIIFFGNSSYNELLIGNDIATIATIFALYGSRGGTNSTLRTDAITATGGTFNFKFQQYQASSGTYTVKATNGVNSRTIAGPISYGGTSTVKTDTSVRINTPLDNEQLEISFDGGYYYLYWMEFIPDKS